MFRFINQRSAIVQAAEEVFRHIRPCWKLLRSALEALLPQHGRVSDGEEDAVGHRERIFDASRRLKRGLI